MDIRNLRRKLPDEEQVTAAMGVSVLVGIFVGIPVLMIAAAIKAMFY